MVTDGVGMGIHGPDSPQWLNRVAAGTAMDSTNADYMSLATSVSKTTSVWAAGSGNGAMDLPAWGVAGESFTVYDELSGGAYTWGTGNFVSLHPWGTAAHVCRLEREVVA